MSQLGRPTRESGGAGKRKDFSSPSSFEVDLEEADGTPTSWLVPYPQFSHGQGLGLRENELFDQ